MSLESDIRQRLERQPLLLMTHIICGYPSLEDNWAMLRLMGEAGVALVEFQFPFSEPIADGPLFSKANQRSLERGTHVDDCFALMRRAANELTFIPLMMGYYNTVFKMGHAAFCERLAAAGGRGFILPDLPPEEATELEREADARDLAPIHLMTPASPDERLRLIASHGKGFFYCVARRGVTGAHTRFGAELDHFLRRCRGVTDLPLAVGFGLSKPEDIQFLKGKIGEKGGPEKPHADVAVIGTAFLQTWETAGPAGAATFLHSLAAAILP